MNSKISFGLQILVLVIGVFLAADLSYGFLSSTQAYGTVIAVNEPVGFQQVTVQSNGQILHLGSGGVASCYQVGMNLTLIEEPPILFGLLGNTIQIAAPIFIAC